MGTIGKSKTTGIAIAACMALMLGSCTTVHHHHRHHHRHHPHHHHKAMVMEQYGELPACATPISMTDAFAMTDPVVHGGIE